MGIQRVWLVWTSTRQFGGIFVTEKLASAHAAHIGGEVEATDLLDCLPAFRE